VTLLRRIGLSVVTAILVLLVDAAPASAHTVSGQGATNFKTTQPVVSPAVAGLRVRSIEAGSRLQLTWTGSEELIVQGYENEPYLRLGPDGIFRNRRSPATYLNTVRSGAVNQPPDVDPTAPPDWVRIGSGHTVAWHDHRTHWMGGLLPVDVRSAPGSFHDVVDWKVGMTVGSQPVVATGSLDWVPSSSALPWLALIVVLIGLGALAGVVRRWAGLLLVGIAVLVLADVLHALGTGLDFAGTVGHRLLLVVSGSYYSIVAWALGLVAIRLLAKRSVDGLFAAVFTALVIGLFGGLADVVSLSRSQVPNSFGAATARLLIAVSIGLGGGVIIGSILAFRRNRPLLDPDLDEGDGDDPVVPPVGPAAADA